MYYYTCETQRLTLQMGLGGNGKEKEQAAFKANKSLNTKGTHATRIHHVITAQHTTVLLDIFCSFWLLSHEKSWQIINYLNYLTITVFSVVQMNNDNKNQEYKIMLVAFARLSPLFFFSSSSYFCQCIWQTFPTFKKVKMPIHGNFCVICRPMDYGGPITTKKNLTGQKKERRKTMIMTVHVFQLCCLKAKYHGSCSTTLH